MRRIAVAAVAVLLAAAACGGQGESASVPVAVPEAEQSDGRDVVSAPEAPQTTQQPQRVATEGTTPAGGDGTSIGEAVDGEATPETEPSDDRIGGSQPVWAEGAAPEEYLSDVIAWMFGSPTALGTPTDAAEYATDAECFGDAFVGSFDTARLSELALASSELDLSMGFPAGVLADNEVQALIAAMEPCVSLSLGASLRDVSIPGQLEETAGQTISPETVATFQAGLAECLSNLIAADDFASLVILSILGDAPQTDARLAAVVSGACDDALVVPVIAELLAAEAGVGLDAAQCAVRHALPALQPQLASDPADAELASMVFGFKAMAALNDCGESLPDPTVDNELASESPPAGAADTVVDSQRGDLLDTVVARGHLNCGVSGSAVAFSETQPDGSHIGFDADYCRAVAAALFGDANAVVIIPLAAARRFSAVQAGEVDVLMRNTTWTQSRDVEVGMDFGPTTYYDGQQFMARESDGFSGSSQVADIAGAVVCANAGTIANQNIADAAEAAGLQMNLRTFEDFDQVAENFINGACDVITTNGSALVGRKVNQQPADDEWVIFPSTPISREPLGPVYRQNESSFADVVNWTVYATVIADEKGITAANVDDMAATPPDAEAGRLLGVGGYHELQAAMGLAPDAFLQAISQVGNYDEIFSRHFVPLGLTREGSPNASWLDGGLIYAPPAR